MPLPSKKLIDFKGPILQPGSFFFQVFTKHVLLPQCHKSGMSFITLGVSPWLRIENRSNWENRPPCFWKCKTERLTERQECKTFQVLWKEQKNPLIREAGDRTLYLAHTLQNRAFYLPSLHETPILILLLLLLLLYHSFSFTLVSSLLLAVAGILTTGNSIVGLG